MTEMDRSDSMAFVDENWISWEAGGGFVAHPVIPEGWSVVEIPKDHSAKTNPALYHLAPGEYAWKFRGKLQDGVVVYTHKMIAFANYYEAIQFKLRWV